MSGVAESVRTAAVVGAALLSYAALKLIIKGATKERRRSLSPPRSRRRRTRSRRRRERIEETSSSSSSSSESEQESSSYEPRKMPAKIAKSKQYKAPKMKRTMSVQEAEGAVTRLFDQGTDDLTASHGMCGWEGFSMEDAREHAETQASKAKAREPSEVLQDLQKGNARFWMGMSSKIESSAFERRALIMQQYPAVAILGCSDSRVPIEIVFDQGLGDIFVIRVAGNCLDLATTASLEYALHHLKVKVLVVMGHEGCGAVKAANQSLDKINTEPEALATVLTQIKDGLDEKRLSNVLDARAHDREAVVTNVKRQVERLTKDDAIMQKVNDRELIIVGAFYEISSGIVDFFYEVADNLHHGVQSRYDVAKRFESRERRQMQRTFSEPGIAPPPKTSL